MGQFGTELGQFGTELGQMGNVPNCPKEVIKMAAKTKTIFVCNSCGYESTKWLGKCPSCNEWNTFFEEKISKNVDKATANRSREKKL